MNGRFKRISFVAALAGFVAAAGAWQLGFVAWLPEAAMADGRTAPYRAEDVQRCLKAETLALFDLPAAVRFWHACRDDLIHGQALSGFELRASAIAGSGLGAPATGANSSSLSAISASHGRMRSPLGAAGVNSHGRSN